MNNLRNIVALLGALLVLSVTVPSCSSVPLTGRRQLNLIPGSQMLSMSAKEYSDFLKTNKPITNTAQSQMVVKIGKRIQGAVERMEVGGRDLTAFMSKLLSERGLPAAVSQPQRATSIKEELCYVATDFEQEMKRLDEVSATYQLPDGQVCQFLYYSMWSTHSIGPIHSNGPPEF